jgi:hypothetical protein
MAGPRRIPISLSLCTARNPPDSPHGSLPLSPLRISPLRSETPAAPLRGAPSSHRVPPTNVRRTRFARPRLQRGSRRITRALLRSRRGTLASLAPAPPCGRHHPPTPRIRRRLAGAPPAAGFAPDGSRTWLRPDSSKSFAPLRYAKHAPCGRALRVSNNPFSAGGANARGRVLCGAGQRERV